MKQAAFDLFGEPLKPAAATQISVPAKAKQTLTKQQKDFNRLVKRVENLRQEIVASTAVLDAHLKTYSEQIRPCELELIAVRREHLLLLVPYMAEKKVLTKKEKGAIAEYAREQLEELLMLLDKEPDEELKALFQLVNGISFEDASNSQFEEMKEELEGMFSEMGYELDLEGLDKDLKPEELAAKLAELQEQFSAQAEANEAKQAGKKKTKKQAARELLEKQKEEAKKKSISSIYKQLAKILHPDLESDPTLKLQKEEVMKQLTAAYDNNDLHTLLRLEIEWMERQENKIATLADEKLMVYNEVLKEQVAELEHSIYELSEHPRYSPLFRFADYEYLVRNKSLARKISEIKEITAAVQETIKFDLKSGNPLVYIKELAQYQMEQQKYNKSMDALLNDFLKYTGR